MALSGPLAGFQRPALGCFGLRLRFVAGAAEGAAVVGVVGAASPDVEDVVGYQGASGGVGMAALGAPVPVPPEDGGAESFVGRGAGSACPS